MLGEKKRGNEQKVKRRKGRAYIRLRPVRGRQANTGTSHPECLKSRGYEPSSDVESAVVGGLRTALAVVGGLRTAL